MPMRHLLVPALLALITPGLMALEVGEKAPPLAGVTWVKGGAAALGAQPTIVEFWATWCGPCRTSIPHLTKLAAAHRKDLTVVGLSDEDEATVTPFVTGQGAAMDYHVGLADDKLKQEYMAAEQGIPTAFLVGTDGTVLWKGHPMALDRPLRAVLDGTWNAVAETKRSQRADEKPLLAKIVAKTGEILADDPTNEEAFGLRLGLARHLNDQALADATWAAVPVDRLSADEAAGLAQRILVGENASPLRLDLAWRLAQRALAAEPDSAAGLTAQAAVQYRLGLLDAAIATQERALKADGSPEQQDALAAYREAQRVRDLVQAGKPVTPPASTATSQSKAAAEGKSTGASNLPATAPAGIVP